MLPGVADTGINGPVTLAHLCQHPTNKLLAPVDFVGLAAVLQIGLIYRLAPLG